MMGRFILFILGINMSRSCKKADEYKIKTIRLTLKKEKYINV